MGNPFINAVYIGHPGWKAMGGRIGYSAVTGIVVLVLTWLGIIAVVSALIPLVAILPILLYIGMLIGSQAFQDRPSPRAGNRAGTVAATRRMGKIADRQRPGHRGHERGHGGNQPSSRQSGVLYDGLATLGGGATLAGIILGAVTVCIIDRAFDKAAAFALAGCILTFFGFIHGPEGIGVDSSPTVAVSYLGVAAILFYLSRATQIPPSADGYPRSRGRGRLI